MSKTRQKGHSEVENLRGYIRELEKTVRSLQKQLRQFEKYEARSQDTDVATDTEDTYVEIKATADCPSCGKGKLVQTMELMGKIYGQCLHCEHRGRIK
jgi:DNA repair exonuclease SbcCD ATPase subunit